MHWPIAQWWRKRAREGGSFLGRLRRDVAGNTIVLAAAAILPLTAMVGSGVDMGRAYLIKTRLQQACDAGALAARKSITGNALTTDARTQGREFFDINLRTGSYSVQSVNFVLSDVMRRDTATNTNVATGTVHGEATATVPMTLMNIFGFQSIALTASCETELNVANNDIMFVLDTTGSMACLPGDSLSNCQNYVVSNTASNPFRSIEKTDGSGKNVSRIDAVRKAVVSFFNTVSTAQAPGTRLRIGFVPYSSGVNIGEILPIGTMVSSRSYDSRTANFNTAHWKAVTGTWSAYGNEETYPVLLNTADCDAYGNNQAFSETGNYATSFAPNPSGNPAPALPNDVYGGTTKPAAVTSTSYQRSYWDTPRGNPNSYRTCKRKKSTATTSYDTPPTWRFTDYSYAPQTFSLTNYLTAGTTYGGNAVRVATAISTTAEVTNAYKGPQTPLALATLVDGSNASGITVVNSEWDGCIEERLTGNADIDGAANSDDTRWAPTWPAVMYNRPGTANVSNTANDEADTNYWTPRQDAYGYLQSGYFCPKAAQLPAVMTASDVSNYVNSPTFVPSGFTYHDVGMIWAARLMSQNSVFSGSHGAAPNGKPVTRHIIFMTDGDMETNARVYSPYGIEAMDQRVQKGSGTALNTLHNARFAAACTAAKDKGISVWVIAFGQALTTSLTNCATSSDQAFPATSTTELNTAFANIASRIADLRLTS